MLYVLDFSVLARLYLMLYSGRSLIDSDEVLMCYEIVSLVKNKSKITLYVVFTLYIYRWISPSATLYFYLISPPA